MIQNPQRTPDGYYVYAIEPVDEGWSDSRYVTPESMPEDVIAAAKVLGWDGDVRGNHCETLTIPCEHRFEVMWVWKQDNDGITFVATPVRLPHLDALAVVF